MFNDLAGMIDGFVDPGGFRQGLGTRLLAFEAAGVKIKRLVECLLAMIQDNIGIAVMDGFAGSAWRYRNVCAVGYTTGRISDSGLVHPGLNRTVGGNRVGTSRF